MYVCHEIVHLFIVHLVTCDSFTGALCPFPPLPEAEVVVVALARSASEGMSQPTREGVVSTTGSDGDGGSSDDV